MEYPQQVHRPQTYLTKWLAIIVFVFLVSLSCAAQTPPAGQQPEMPWFQELRKNPELLAEFGRLVGRLQNDLQFPASRSHSRLLPLLPESTHTYGAFSNYGDVTHQALTIFQQELQGSSALREWWHHGDLATAGPKVEDALEKFYQLSQYFGDEIVVSAASKGPEPSILIVAEVRKPGLEKFLQQLLNEAADKSKPPIRVWSPQELATAEDHRPPQELEVLVRSDFVIGGPDLATLRSFSAQLDRGSHDFTSTPFGKRIGQAYEGGVTTLAAVDIHNILSQIPHVSTPDQLVFQSSGFAEMKYLVWEHTNTAGQAPGQAELSFIGPRRRAASWLASPARMGSLDFVSPRAIAVGSAMLKSPVEILADAREIASVSNPNVFAALDQLETAFKFSLKEDLLRHLEGEVTFELDNLTQPVDVKQRATPVRLSFSGSPQGDAPALVPVWKAILRVNEPERLQQTFVKLLAAGLLTAEPHNDEGTAFYTVRVPSKTNVEIAYAFVGGYLVIASSREALAEGIRVQRAGTSLGQSKKFLASLPPGHSSGISALFYEDPIAAVAMQMRRLAPDLAGALAQLYGQGAPVMVCAYGEESAIREASTSIGFDAAGVVLVGAAVAIPNLLRSRIAANEASAAGTVRTVVVGEVTYSSTYPERGYAPDLATLGPDPAGPDSTGKLTYSADHAGLISDALGNPNCTAGAWCTKSGYRVVLSGVCKQKLCTEFVVVASPVDSSTGGKNFCSTSDGVIRFNAEPPLVLPVSVADCRGWPPLQ
jgi:hypothetical protein